MGDNATASWAWHNTVVGQGYQAKGVIRQPGSIQSKVLIDLKKENVAILKSVEQEKKPAHSMEPCEEMNTEKKTKKKRKHKHGSEDEKRDQKEKKEKKEKKHKKKNKKDKSSSKDDPSNFVDSFNPLLQFLASSLSNRTRVFSLENE
jgi:hypothetical protein